MPREQRRNREENKEERKTEKKVKSETTKDHEAEFAFEESQVVAGAVDVGVILALDHAGA